VSAVPVAIEGGLPGAVTKIADLIVTLRSPKAFPPGQPLEFVLTQSGVRLQARSIGSKRLPESDAFELRVRLINLRRETREALAAAWAASGE
jgi:hypothetical protein